MRIAVRYKPSFLRQYKKLEPALQDDVYEKIELFKNPKNHTKLHVHKLKGILAGRFSFSVNYQYRIVYKYLDKKTVVFLVIGDHDIYR